MNDKFNKHPSLCWNCRKAIGDCQWSKSFTPIEGWKAIYNMKENEDRSDYFSYDIYECPEFERDAYRGGQVRA